MEHHTSEPMTPFDQLVSSQNLQILKLLIPYTPPENQRFLAIYVKFLELQHTISFFQNFQNDVASQDFEKKIFSPTDLIQEMQPYISEEISETMDTILNMMNMMEVFQTVQNASGSAEDTDSGFDPMSMMKNMLNPEQQDMFEMYNTMFAQENETKTETENPTNFNEGEIEHD